MKTVGLTVKIRYVVKFLWRIMDEISVFAPLPDQNLHFKNLFSKPTEVFSVYSTLRALFLRSHFIKTDVNFVSNFDLVVLL